MSPNFAILRCKLTLPGRSIDDKQRRPRRGRGPVRGVAEIRDLVAHPRRELELAAVAQLAVELALQHVEHVAAVAPMVGEIARRILDHPNPEIADVERAPLGLPGLAGMDVRLDLALVGDCEGGGGELHLESCVRAGAGVVSVRSRHSLRHCEEPLRRSNPDYLRGQILDCFATLAMTWDRLVHRMIR